MTTLTRTLGRDARPGVLAELFWPARTATRTFLLAVAGSLVLAGLAQVAIPIPGSPVPITLQTLGVVLAGALLGPRAGALACGLYLLEGAAGLPVFAGGGAGVARITAGPTGGYLISFLPAAYAAGWLAERGWDRTPLRAAVAFAASLGLILLGGTLWLVPAMGWTRAFAAGYAPFVPGALIKAAVAAALLPAGWRVLGRRDPSDRGAARADEGPSGSPPGGTSPGS